MRQSAAEVADAAEAGPEIPHAIRARLYASALYTMDTARLAVSDLYARSSSVAYASRNPVERSLLTTGVLDAVMESHHQKGAHIETPELEVQYQAPADSGL